MRTAEARKAADRFKERAARLVGAIGGKVEVAQDEDHRRADFTRLLLGIGRLFDLLDEAHDLLLRGDELAFAEQVLDLREQSLLFGADLGFDVGQDAVAADELLHELRVAIEDRGGVDFLGVRGQGGRGE